MTYKFRVMTLFYIQFEVSDLLLKHKDIQRSSYLKQAMDLLKNPLRNDLPIPWEKILELNGLCNIRVKQENDDSMDSFERSLKWVEGAPTAFTDEGVQQRQSKRRKVVLLVKSPDKNEVRMPRLSLLLADNNIDTKCRCIS
jgi:hypothetical protein